MLAKQMASHNRQRNLAKNRETKKTAKKKLRKIVPIFAIFLSYFSTKKTILTHKTVINCYHKIAQAEGVSSIPIRASKTNNRKKTQKLNRKSAKYIKNLRIIIKFILISRNLQTSTDTSLKLKQNQNQTS